MGIPGRKGLTILLHAVLAGGFFFALQRYGMKETVETSLMWAAFFAAAAGLVAWKQAV